MGRNNRLGYDGEIGVLNFILDHYYPEWDEYEEGVKAPWRRERTHLKDFGDILGPHTTLEVKNRKSSDGSVSAILDDAEKKGVESGLRFWSLVSKVPGIGTSNAGGWEAFMTVEQMFNGWGIRPREYAEDYEQFLADLPGLCSPVDEDSPEDFNRSHADLHARLRNFDGPNNDWTYEIGYLSAVTKMREARAETLEEFDIDPVSVNRTVPLLISRRKEYRDQPEKWYVALHLHSLMRISECIGTVPQKEDDYLEG